MYLDFSNEADPAAAMRAHYAAIARRMGTAAERPVLMRPRPVPKPSAPPIPIEAVPVAEPQEEAPPRRVYDWPRPLVRDVIDVRSEVDPLPLPLPRIRRTPASEIVAAVAYEHGISIEAIVGKRRDLSVVRARHAAMAAVYLNRPDMSLPQIGRIFGRDHTSCLHAIKKLGVWRGGAAQ